MKLLNLGKVPWETTQLIYHAMANLGQEALCLVSPAKPYVCIGYHQDAAQEVDLDFCKADRIPVFRREVGGGAVYLDGDQLFFHLVLRRDNPSVPAGKEAFYRKFLGPIIDVYRRIGIAAEYKPINDVIVGNRKISGTGVGEIGDCIVFVGNLIVDFNYDMMCRVLRVPDEKFRDKVHKTLTANLSTIRRELGKDADRWSEEKLNAMLAEEFLKIVGPMEPGEVDEILLQKMGELKERMSTEDWLLRKGKQSPGRSVTIRSGAKVMHRLHKAKGGLIRADFEFVDGRFGQVAISGDFFCFPETAVSSLEAVLSGKPVEETRNVISGFFSAMKVEMPGIGEDDWLSVLSV